MIYNPEFYESLHDILFTSIFGIIGINSLLLYLVIGNRVFGHYCVLIFGLTFHYSLLFFVNDVPLIIARVSVITAMTTMLGAVLFTQSFIEFNKENHPGWTKYYLILQWTIGSVIILQLFNILLVDSNGLSDILVYSAAFLALIGTVSNFLVSAWLWKKTPLAKQYLLINIPMLLAGFAYTVLWFMLDSGNYQADILIRFIVSGGMAFQMVLFSVFVGYKIKTAEKDKLDFEKDINKKLSEEIQMQTRIMALSKEEVETQKNKLEELNELKNKLFSLVAHDLRNPLHHLSALVELMESETVSAETKISISKTTRMEVTDSIAVIDRLLHWTYKQLDGIDTQPEILSLSVAVEDVSKELKSLSDSKGVKILSEHDQDEIFFDQDMLRVVLRNLLSNAIKFSYEGGSIKVSSSAENGKLNLKVIDQGLGMNPKWYDELIQSGRPAVKEGTKGEKGSGFGLLITKDFVEMNGGTLKCESKEGKGTTFTIELDRPEGNQE